MLSWLGIVVFAYPTFRIKRHDTFERMHRLMGWTATALVWSQVAFFLHSPIYVRCDELVSGRCPHERL